MLPLTVHRLTALTAAKLTFLVFLLHIPVLKQANSMYSIVTDMISACYRIQHRLIGSS